MYHERKKGIIIAIIITILVIAGAIGGYFVYTKTDLLKSNQTLFFKYMGQALESIEYVENRQMTEITNLKQEMPYTIVGNLSYTAGEENTNSNATVLENMKIGVEAKVDKAEEKAYAKARVFQNDQDLFTLEYAHSNNIYALKSDEIVTAFLGIENENLKVLAQKLGIIDTSVIPNSIRTIDINELFKMTEEEKEHIKETYLAVLLQNINQENFTKENNVAVSKQNVMYYATGYRLNLNAEERKQIEVALLQALKEDSITLNLLTTKAKILGLDENYTQVNNLTKQIEKQITAINNSNYPLEAGISIMVYVDNGDVVLTEIILRNETKFTIYGETKEDISSRYLLIENLSATAEYNKIELQEQETRSNIESIYNVFVNIDDKVEINIDVTNTGVASENNLKTNCEITINQEELTSIINYEQEMIFQDKIDNVIELSRSNCGVLNDYTTEQLQGLLQSIQQRIQTLFLQKIEQIIVQETENEI